MMTSPPPQPSPGSSDSPGPRRSRAPWIVVGVLILIMLVMAGVGGCVAMRLLGEDDQASAPASTAADDAPADPTEDAPADDAPAAGSGAPGASWDDPAPFGSTGMVPLEPGRAFEITIGEPAWDVEPTLPDRGGEAPPEGMVYVEFPVTATYRGEGTAIYDEIVSMVYLDATGAEHDEALGVTTKNPPEELPEFTDGTSTEFEVVFLLPEEDEGEGVIGVGPAATAPAGRVFVEAG